MVVVSSMAAATGVPRPSLACSTSTTARAAAREGEGKKSHLAAPKHTRSSHFLFRWRRPWPAVALLETLVETSRTRTNNSDISHP